MVNFWYFQVINPLLPSPFGCHRIIVNLSTTWKLIILTNRQKVLCDTLKTVRIETETETNNPLYRQLIILGIWVIFRIRVQATNSIGLGAFSSPVKVTTRSLPPRPPFIDCVTVGYNSLKLKWRMPDTRLISYSIVWKCWEMMAGNDSNLDSLFLESLFIFCDVSSQLNFIHGAKNIPITFHEYYKCRNKIYKDIIYNISI